MFNTLWTMVKVAGIIVLAALAISLAAFAEHILPIILVLIVIGFLAFVVLHRPKPD